MTYTKVAENFLTYDVWEGYWNNNISINNQDKDIEIITSVSIIIHANIKKRSKVLIFSHQFNSLHINMNINFNNRYNPFVYVAGLRKDLFLKWGNCKTVWGALLSQLKWKTTIKRQKSQLAYPFLSFCDNDKTKHFK